MALSPELYLAMISMEIEQKYMLKRKTSLTRWALSTHLEQHLICRVEKLSKNKLRNVAGKMQMQKLNRSKKKSWNTNSRVQNIIVKRFINSYREFSFAQGIPLTGNINRFNRHSMKIIKIEKTNPTMLKARLMVFGATQQISWLLKQHLIVVS